LDENEKTMNYEEFKQKMEEKETIWKRIRYAPIRFWNGHFSNWHRRIIWFFVRGKHGFAPNDCWSLDSYLAEMLPKALRHLKKYNSGCPQELYDKTKKDNECWKWDDILEEIAIGFDEIYKVIDSKHWDKITDKNWTDKDKEIAIQKDKVSKEKFEKSMDLIKKYFTSLWD